MRVSSLLLPPYTEGHTEGHTEETLDHKGGERDETLMLHVPAATCPRGHEFKLE